MSTLRVSNLQNEASANNQITLGTDGFAQINGVAMPTAGPLSSRNLIVNGGMAVSQRGTTFTSVGNGNYTLDRWQFGFGTSSTFDVAQSSTAPAGFASSLKVDCTTTSTPTTTQETFVRHRIEGQNLQQLQYGTSGAQSIALSFWVRSNKTGNYGIRFSQEDTSPVRQYATTYTISSADTWEYKTVVITGDTSGTINNDNGEGLQIRFYLQAGPDRAGTPAETWNTDTDNRATDLNFGDSTDNEWLLSGVQLEVGSVATPFEHRSYGQELALCQRYYCLIADGTNKAIGTGGAYSSGNSWSFVHLPVEMRAAPSLDYASGTDYYTMIGNNASDEFNDLILEGQTTSRMARLSAQANISLTQGYAYFMQTNNASANVAFSAEL